MSSISSPRDLLEWLKGELADAKQAHVILKDRISMLDDLIIKLGLAIENETAERGKQT